MYFRGEPQYPFGHGLSYTTFELDNLRTSAETLDPGGSVAVTVDLHNRGSRDGDEVVQLYVRFPASKVERPLKQLRGFQRVTARAAETKTVTLNLRAADLAYWSPKGHAWVVEPGPVEILVGNSSSDRALGLRKTITVRPSP
jgi:beta-glucosidase